MSKDIFFKVAQMSLGSLLRGEFSEEVKVFLERHPDLTLQQLLGGSRLEEMLDFVRRTKIESVYKRTRSWKRTAVELKVSRVTLYNWRRQLNIDID